MVTKKDLGALLFLVSRAHHNYASQVFQAIDMPRGQPGVLFELDHQDGLTQSVLAARMELTPATLTNMLHRMETAGLIHRERDAQDGRISHIFLTDKGKARLQEAKSMAERIDKAAFAGFTPEEQVIIGNFLHRIHENLTHP